MAKRTKKNKAPAPDGEPKPATFSWGAMVKAAIFIAAALFIYGPVLRGDWLWDDDRYITDNTLLRSLAGLGKIWLEPGVTLDYYPVTASVQWVQWHLWGMDTLGYHVTNVGLHLVSAFLVWRLLSKFHLRLAWISGLLFVVHPVQVESVAWISEIKNTLSLPFFLLAMICWIDYEDYNRRRDYFLALGLFLLAMLSKPVMAAFPFLILLYAWWKRGQVGWSDLKASAPFLGISLILGLVSVCFTQHAQASAGTESLAPAPGIAPRLAASGLMLAFSFSKAFLPVGLLPIYPGWPVDPPAPAQFLPWLVLAGIVYYLWMKREGWGRHALLGLGFFLLMLAPVLGFVAANHTTMTWSLDHLSYLPMVGLIGLTMAAVEQFYQRVPAPLRLLGAGALAVVLGLLAWESRGYASQFVNREVLWTYTLQRNPQAWEARNNLGLDLLKAGRVAEAVAQLQQALAIAPKSIEAHNNLGNALKKDGRMPEAVDQYQQAVAINPARAEAHNNLGLALLETGRVTEAIEQYEQAVTLDPGYAEAHYNLGLALAQAGRGAEAVKQFEQALAIKPDYAEPHNNLGVAFAQSGHLVEAMEQYRQALNLKSDFAEAHNNLGNALKESGRMPEAVVEYGQALKIDPNFVDAHYNLGDAFRQSGQASEAIEQYEQALKGNSGLADAHSDLGLTLLNVGRVPEAIEQLEQALKIDPILAEAHNNLGIAFYQIGRTQDAMEQFEQALKIDPDYAEARNNLAKMDAVRKPVPGKN